MKRRQEKDGSATIPQKLTEEEEGGGGLPEGGELLDG